jgi:hypothetical protein
MEKSDNELFTVQRRNFEDSGAPPQILATNLPTYQAAFDCIVQYVEDDYFFFWDEKEIALQIENIGQENFHGEFYTVPGIYNGSTEGLVMVYGATMGMFESYTLSIVNL